MAAAKIGPCVVKAQVPTGKRGKAGGIKLAGYAGRGRKRAGQILGMRIGDYTVERLLVEEQAKIEREFYAAVLHRRRRAQAADPVLDRRRHGHRGDRRGKAGRHPPPAGRHRRAQPSPRATLPRMLKGLQSRRRRSADRRYLDQLYAAFRARDAELLEINPLALLADGRVVALDCKFVLDDAASTGSPRSGQRSAAPAR